MNTTVYEPKHMIEGMQSILATVSVLIEVEETLAFGSADEEMQYRVHGEMRRLISLMRVMDDVLEGAINNSFQEKMED